MISLTEDEKAYFSQISARIAARIQKSGEVVSVENMDQFVSQAHSELTEFANEMRAGRTDRAKRAAQALSAAVWGSIQRQEINRKMIQLIEY